MNARRGRHRIKQLAGLVPSSVKEQHYKHFNVPRQVYGRIVSSVMMTFLTNIEASGYEIRRKGVVTDNAFTRLLDSLPVSSRIEIETALDFHSERTHNNELAE